MIKEKSQAWAAFSASLGRLFSNLPLPPAFYTWSTLPAAIIGFAAIVKAKPGLGIFFFLLAGLFDIIDGAVARHTARTSYAGAFLDGSLDRFVDFFVIFSYFWLPLTTPLFGIGQWICIALFLAIMPSFEVAYANHRRAVHDPDEKLIWRILNRGEMYALMLLIILASIYSGTLAGYLLVLLALLSFITTIQTLWLTLRLAEKPASSLSPADKSKLN